jgi:hypothetical protein
LTTRWALLGALLAGACTLPQQGLNEVGLPANACSNEGEVGGACGSEGECLRGLCRPLDVAPIELVLLVQRSQLSRSSLLQVPLFEIPPLSQLRALARQDGLLERTLPTPSTLEVAVLGPDPKKSAPSTSARGCFFQEQAPSRALPFHVALRPSTSLRGLPLFTFARNASDPKLVSPPLDLRASLLLPPATYDLYLTPTVDAACPIPPLLRSEVSLASGLTLLNIELPATSRLDALISAPPALDLSSWSLQLLDGRTGLRVSTVAGLLPEGPGKWRMGNLYAGGVAPLEYYRPSRPPSEPGSTLFLLLSPPPGALAPRLLWDLAALDLFGTGEIALDLSSLDLAPVKVEVRAEHAVEGAGQRSWIWATSLPDPGALPSAPAGAIASFALGPLATDEQGIASLSLLPGRYQLHAAAAAEGLGLFRQVFEFTRDPGDPGATLAGFSLALQGAPAVEIPLLSAFDSGAFAGVPFEWLAVEGTSSAGGPLLVQPPAPRGASGRSDGDGVLRARLDAGTHDLIVRIPDSSGFPWMVKPSVSLPLGSPGALRASLPIEVQGRLLDPSVGSSLERPFSGSWVQVFARVEGRFLPVAAAPLAPDGSYRLLLPSRF